MEILLLLFTPLAVLTLCDILHDWVNSRRNDKPKRDKP